VDGQTYSGLPGEPASFWRRFGAALIDGLLLSIVNGILRAALGGAGVGLGVLIGLAYFTYFHGSRGYTPGDAALRIRVVDIRDRPGEVIGYGRAFGRWLMSIVSTIALLLGYLWMIWDPRKQTWHDKVARSLPIRER
jgi:uncharacterized RDD family membrane protein YckC